MRSRVGQPRRRAFHDAAQFDGIDHIDIAKAPDDEAAIGQAIEQAFLGKARQGLAYRGAGNLQGFGQRHFEQAHAAGQFAIDDLFAQFDDGAATMGRGFAGLHGTIPVPGLL